MTGEANDTLRLAVKVCSTASEMRCQRGSLGVTVKVSSALKHASSQYIETRRAVNSAYKRHCTVSNNFQDVCQQQKVCSTDVSKKPSFVIMTKFLQVGSETTCSDCSELRVWAQRWNQVQMTSSSDDRKFRSPRKKTRRSEMTTEDCDNFSSCGKEEPRTSKD